MTSPGRMFIRLFFIAAASAPLIFFPGGAGTGPSSSRQPEFTLDPDPVQGLESFMERAGVKPWELFQCGESEALKTGRVIFGDRTYGTEIWMLDNSHTPESDPGASVWTCWNADASTLFLPRGRRYLNGELVTGWMFSSDFSKLLRMPGSGRPFWDRKDPDVFYNFRQGVLTRLNRKTGESRVLAEKESLGGRLYGMTRDGRYVFVDVVNGGIWVPYERGSVRIPRMSLHAGRQRAPDGSVLVGGHHSTTSASPWGHLYRIRVGILVCRETGETRRLIAPVSGETTYLETFRSGRVRFPSGEEWDGYGLDRGWDEVPVPHDLSVDELYDLFWYLPVMTHGHRSASSDGRFWAVDGHATTIWRMKEGTAESAITVSAGSNYHLHWKNHPNYLVAWIRGWIGMADDGPFSRPDNANLIYQGFADGTWNPVLDTKHRFTPARSGGAFEMLSPDATKIHYASSMTGRSKNYIAVLARPRPPVNLKSEGAREGVRLGWEAPAAHAEIKGYLVYRSARSGRGYELLTPEPVEGLEWTDTSARRGAEYYYVVTSLEHSRIESGYSDEVSGGAGLRGLRGPFRLYIEPEWAIFDLPYSEAQTGLALGRDRLEASNWFYLYRHPDWEKGSASLSFDAPAGGDYDVWARIRSSDGTESGWRIGAAGGDADVSTDSEGWAWVKAGSLTLSRGRNDIVFSTSDGGAQLDLVCLTTDGRFSPEGVRPEEAPRPSTPRGLSARNAEPRTNILTWHDDDSPYFSHFNVYSSRERFREPAREYLIGSVTTPEFIDWGLRAGTLYHYAATSVDRRGNESAPVFRSVRTPPRGREEFSLELAFAEAKLGGEFDRSDRAAGTRGPAFVVPLEEGATASWGISVPEDMTVYLWPRYLPGLERRQSRRVAVSQDISVELNGIPLTGLELPTAINISRNAVFYETVIEGEHCFKDENLLEHGDFSRAGAGSREPPGWEIVRAPSGMGEVAVVEDDEAVGGRALRLRKDSVETHLPIVRNPGPELSAGELYEFSARIKGDITRLNLRAFNRTRGPSSAPAHPSGDFIRYAFRFIPERSGVFPVGFSSGQDGLGEAVIDDVVLRRIDDLPGPDSYISKEGNPLAPHFWTWGAPVEHQLLGVRLPAGEHEITLRNLAPEVRYDVLYITDEPSFIPPDGRLRQ